MVQHHIKEVVVLQHWNSCGNHRVPVIHVLWYFCGPLRFVCIFSTIYYEAFGVLALVCYMSPSLTS